MKSIYRILGLLTTLAILSACGWLQGFDEVIPDRQKEYQKAKSLPDLEVPPDLSADAIKDTMAIPDIDESGTATYSTYQERIAARRKADGRGASGRDTTTGESEAPAADRGADARLAEQPLAASAAAASPAPDPGTKAQLVDAGGGKSYLVVAGDMDQAWSSMGRALDQAGIAIENQDRSRGVYYVRYLTEKAQSQSFWSSLAFWRNGENDKYQITLTAVGENTEVVVLNNKGNWDSGTAAGQLLSLLQTQFDKN